MNTIRFSGIASSSPLFRLAGNITDHWLLGLRETNPAILDMFHERDTLPCRDLLWWSGEFAGKHLTGAFFIYRLTKDDRLLREMTAFAEELISTQEEDGYLGCFPKGHHLTGTRPQSTTASDDSWDAWGHYHIMYGLYLWYRETGNEAFFAAAERAAGLFLKLFYNPETGNKRLSEIGWTEMNLSVLHIFAILYRETGKKEYLGFAENIVCDFDSENSGRYLTTALSGIDYYKCPKPRWESMHCIIGLTEMYRATGKEEYRKASEQIFRSILSTDVHNTGGFSTAEQAVGNPYTRGAIETCCVVAYNALAVEILKLTGDSTIADHLEKSLYNACMGCWSPTGRWSTYDTPMEGWKIASVQSISFQCRPGSPELNCCAVNAPRAIGMLSEWFLMEEGDTLFINAYESAEITTESGDSIRIRGRYPADGNVHLSIETRRGNVAIRVPAWSAHSRVRIGGDTFFPPAGQYFSVKCDKALEIDLSLDFSTRCELGEADFAGRTCVYRGPLLFGIDASMCSVPDVSALPEIPRRVIDQAPSAEFKDTVRISLPGGITLCNFAALGRTGAWYTTWLPIQKQ